MLMYCPKCNSKHTVKNGCRQNGKQNFKCLVCGVQFVENPSEHYQIPKETKELIDRLLLEKIPLAGIARAVQVSERWLQYYVNDKYESIPRELIVKSKKKGRLTVECDEMWSFVGNKKNKQWIWLAIDRDTREIIGVYVGDRSRDGAQSLWNSLPPVYRQCAVCYTDFWAAYETIIPSKRHRAVGKETGQTNHIERFNNTMRQRISRLVRSTLSFSKKIENHIGAIWLFIHHYNASLLLD
jgi:IS1 family transposase/transposase-like protein